MEAEVSVNGSGELVGGLGGGEVRAEVEVGSGEEDVEPETAPPLGEEAGAYGRFEREEVEDGLKEVVGEVADPVFASSSFPHGFFWFLVSLLMVKASVASSTGLLLFLFLLQEDMDLFLLFFF